MTKAIIHTSVLLTLLSVLFSVSRESTLQELINFAQENQYAVASGEWVVKETFSEAMLSDILANIEQANFIAINNKEQSEVLRFERKQTNNLIETVTIFTREHNNERLVIYHLSGDIKELERKPVDKKINSFIGTIYTNEKLDYACISLSQNGIIDTRYFITDLKANLQIREINRLEESNFVVITGYTEQFKQSIPIENDKMNVQIASRTGANGETTFIIGTPILTTEY
ncbi:TATA-box binding [Amphibacillus marinus]|uniref:TATA-box binding n=1 Tax=Amphibacillus marinus TaxID=872970 RepID=A0A1H8N2L8_9BACI|nr:YwmB family TATA-box binding protein [Amphibacillus marinus]SEO23759.1 TATA-box binding [Amphibacillus marinus]